MDSKNFCFRKIFILLGSRANKTRLIKNGNNKNTFASLCFAYLNTWGKNEKKQK